MTWYIVEHGGQLNGRGKGATRIGYRTIKTAVGVFLSITLSSLVGLQFPTSAGVLTILTIQVTKKRSLINAYKRMAAGLLGLAFGYVIFQVMGYHPVSLPVLILIFVPVLVRLNIQEGFVTSMVIILQLFTERDFSLRFLVNEVSILAIGIGVALLMNVYIPSKEGELLQFQRKIEGNFRVIMLELAKYLKNHETIWDGKEIVETADLLDQAKELSLQYTENRLLSGKDRYYDYFVMREKQFELLERMAPLISELSFSVPQGAAIAEFLIHLSANIHPGNTVYIFLDKLVQMRREIDKTDLPNTREEFEIRAILFCFLREMEQYLLIKQEFHQGT